MFHSSVVQIKTKEGHSFHTSTPKFTNKQETKVTKVNASKERKTAYHEATPSIPPRRPLGIGRGWRGLEAFRSLRRAGKALVQREKERKKNKKRKGKGKRKERRKEEKRKKESVRS